MTVKKKESFVEILISQKLDDEIMQRKGRYTTYDTFISRLIKDRDDPVKPYRRAQGYRSTMKKHSPGDVSK